ncbi:hypothetical protein ANO11243_094140 [Dothideomycetidae sp. 11243]|nr:hypothetical protein ANO11243_094140 [fungal sp. No.11243]
MSSAFSKPKTVLVIGAGGNVGKPTVHYLVAAGFVVSGLTRESSQAELPAGVNHLKTDYSFESLKAAFRGQDAVVNTISGDGLEFGRLIVDAALAAGVKILFPSEYGCDTSQPDAPVLVPYLKTKGEVMDYLKSQQDRISWTALVTGCEFDYGLDRPVLGGYDVPARTATIYDGGDTLFEATTLEQTGRAIALALQHPDIVKNRYVYVNSFTTTQNAVLKSLEKATGQSFTVKHDSIDNLRKGGFEKLKDGDSMGMMPIIASAFYGDFDLTHYSVSKGLDNAAIGLEPEDLDEVIAAYVAERI